jgi:D-glycero-D-manno-heptose 1,7-bisphosphate phosphatase
MKGVGAVFFDRDGVINEVIVRDGKPFSPRKFDDFKLVMGIGDVLIQLKRKGCLNIIITNQPDIARGLIGWEELDKMHNFIRERLPIDDIFVCPHDDKDKCECRKPKPGMFFEVAQKWGIDLNASFMIGDSWKDIEAGKAAGCKNIIIDAEYNRTIETNFRIYDIRSALGVILNEDPK